MHSRLLLAMAVLLVTSSSAAGQNSIEYGRLPIVPPKAPNPAASLATRVGDQTSAAKTTSVIDVPNNQTKASSPAVSTGEARQAPAVPKSPAIFILSNGERLESDNYTLTHDAVQLTQNGVQRTIRMSSVNVPATLAANKQRGIDLKIPADKSQMTLSF